VLCAGTCDALHTSLQWFTHALEQIAQHFGGSDYVREDLPILIWMAHSGNGKSEPVDLW
jgi:hypothetical protein